CEIERSIKPAGAQKSPTGWYRVNTINRCKIRLLMSDVSQSAPGTANPLLSAWQTPFETPPFDQIVPEHFLPAFHEAFADHTPEIEAIQNDPAAPPVNN